MAMAAGSATIFNLRIIRKIHTLALTGLNEGLQSSSRKSSGTMNSQYESRMNRVLPAMAETPVYVPQRGNYDPGTAGLRGISRPKLANWRQLIFVTARVGLKWEKVCEPLLLVAWDVKKHR